MKIIQGGQIVQDTSSSEYTVQAEKLLRTTEVDAKRQRKAAENQEQQRSEIINLSAEQELLKSKLDDQQQALLEQTTGERNHRFASNADSVQSLINGEIIKLSKTDGSNLESAREKVAATLAQLNSAPDSLSFSQMHSETIIPESFAKEKLGLDGLTKDESLLLTKLILSINGIKYTENQDGRLSDISNPKTNLFIPKAHLNYQDPIVLEAGAQLEAEKLIRNLLQRKGIEFTEGVNSVLGTKEFRFPVDGVIGESINIPSTGELQSMKTAERTKSRNGLLKNLLPFAIAATTILPAGVLIDNPEIIGLEKPTPETLALRESRREVNELRLKYPNDSRIENPTNIYIERDAGENVSQALLKVYPGYLDLAHMERQEIEQRILNEQNIANDTQDYPHGSDVISALPQYIKVPSIKDIYQQIKSLRANNESKPGQSLSFTNLYNTLTKRTPIN